MLPLAGRGVGVAQALRPSFGKESLLGVKGELTSVGFFYCAIRNATQETERLQQEPVAGINWCVLEAEWPCDWQQTFATDAQARHPLYLRFGSDTPQFALSQQPTAFCSGVGRPPRHSV